MHEDNDIESSIKLAEISLYPLSEPLIVKKFLFDLCVNLFFYFFFLLTYLTLFYRKNSILENYFKDYFTFSHNIQKHV